MSPLRGSRTMLLVVISCNSPLRLYFLALLFFPINFSISSHFSFSIFPSRYIFSIRRSSFSDSCFNFPLVKKLSSHSSRFFLLYLRLENWSLLVATHLSSIFLLAFFLSFHPDRLYFPNLSLPFTHSSDFSLQFQSEFHIIENSRPTFRHKIQACFFPAKPCNLIPVPMK